MPATHPSRWLLRGLILALAGGAVAGLRLPGLGPPPPPVAVVDVSASVGPGPWMPRPEARIAPSWVAVGETARVVDGRQTTPGVGREGTALGAGLRAAAARFPGRAVWLVTDGRATDGDAEAGARAVVAAGGRVHVSAPVEPAADVALLEAAARRRSAGGVGVRAVLTSSTHGRGRVELVREGRAVAGEDVTVTPGRRQEVELWDRSAPRLALAYQVHWRPDRGTPDTDPANDRLALGVPPDRPAVLIWGDLPPGAWVGPERNVIVRRFLGWEAGALDAADLVVVADVPWRHLGAARTRDLLAFVAGGGRLLLLGGPRAWHGGGWTGTPFEEHLAPLRHPRPDGEPLVVLLVVDRSGSTAGAGGALPHLVRAAREALEDLAPGERLAVLPFAAEPASILLGPGWVEAHGRDRREALVDALEGMTAGGGTDLPAAVEAASELAASQPARGRRVIVLTDGDPDHELDPAALEALRRRTDARGVEVGAVVSGMPAVAARLREALATQPEDVVLLETAAGIPERLRHQLARQRSREERLPAPASVRWEADVPDDLREIEPAWIHDLEPVEDAEVLARAVWAEGEPPPRPFAARRAVGVGEVIALAWGPSGGAAGMADASRLGGLVERLAHAADRGLGASIDGDELVVRVPEAVGVGQLRQVRGPTEVTLIETAPGVFRGPAPGGGEESGPIVIPGEPPRLRALDLPALAPAEHRGAGVDERRLRRLARAGGGVRVEAGGEPPLTGSGPGAPLAPWLLLLAGILLLWERRATEGAGGSARSTGQEASA